MQATTWLLQSHWDCFPLIKSGVAMTGCRVGKPITGWKPVPPIENPAYRLTETKQD